MPGLPSSTMAPGRTVPKSCTAPSRSVPLLLYRQMGFTLSCSYRYKDVVDGWDVARMYAATFRFWLDLLATVPLLYLVGAGIFEFEKQDTVSGFGV